MCVTVTERMHGVFGRFSRPQIVIDFLLRRCSISARTCVCTECVLNTVCTKTLAFMTRRMMMTMWKHIIVFVKLFVLLSAKG